MPSGSNSAILTGYPSTSQQNQRPTFNLHIENTQTSNSISGNGAMAKKFSMHLDDDAELRIEQLQRRTKSSGTADVIRLALLVLDEQINWLRAGGSMFVQASPGAPLRPYHPLLNSDDVLVPEAPASIAVMPSVYGNPTPKKNATDDGDRPAARKFAAGV